MKFSIERFLKIQPRNTLLIACSDCRSVDKETGAAHVLVYHVPGSMINMDDRQDTEGIRNMIEEKEIRKIILTGHYNCGIMNSMFTTGRIDEKTELPMYLQKALSHLQVDPGNPESEKYMIRFFLATQTRRLMQLDFIRQKRAANSLELECVVLPENDEDEAEIMFVPNEVSLEQ